VSTVETTISNVQDDLASQVIRWRISELLRAGYPNDLAVRIAESEADLHLAVNMIEQGCDFATAAEILL
jgi:hypothetical protein